MPTVWLSHETDTERDLSSAQRYGTLRPLLTRSDKPGTAPGPCLWKIYQTLSKEYSNGDYLCVPGGDPLAAVLVGAAIGSLGLDEINMLRYERSRDLEGNRTKVGFYVPVSCKLPWRNKQ